jgi:serine/threonine protein kinase
MRASEIYALGSVLYTMMCGNPPSPLHHSDWVISRLTDGDREFSADLVDIVSSMLSPVASERPNALRVAQLADSAWAKWRKETDEGRIVKTIEDVRDEERAAEEKKNKTKNKKKEAEDRVGFGTSPLTDVLNLIPGGEGRESEKDVVKFKKTYRKLLENRYGVEAVQKKFGKELPYVT